MLKQFSLVIATSLLLTACGGTENKKDRTPTPGSSAIASSMASSIAMSSEPASSAAASSVASGPTNKALKISVTDGGSDFWHVQLRQIMPTGLVSGKTYNFSYKVKASEFKTLSVAINLGDDNSYAALPTANDVSVTTDWQTVNGTFTSTLTDATVELQANLGNNGMYDIWFDDFSLTEADGSNQQVKNGGIVSAEDWMLNLNSGAKGSLSIIEEAAPEPVINKALKIDVTQPGTETWHVQLRQIMPTGLISGKSYIFSFKAKASEAKTLSVAINLGDDNSYAALPTENDFAVTSAWQSFTGTFTATLTDTTTELQANLGKNGQYQVWFDDFSLTEADGSNQQVTKGGIVSAEDWLLNNNAPGLGVLSVE